MEGRLDSRRALEALRSGVPNRDAVRALGCGQAHVEKRFTEQLAEVEKISAPKGLLVSGGFGTGKSHLLEYLEHTALSQNCVCSRIAISKETPLYELGKLYRAAVDQAVVPGRTGLAIQEIAHMLRPGSGRYAEFYRWANSSESGLPQLFPATLFLHERLNNDPELVENVTAFWAGDRIATTRVKQGLQQAGAPKMFDVRPVPMRDLGLHRFVFASQLIRAAGFNGWVILIDEVELIGRYSPLQRGRSYAELARWMGQTDSGFRNVASTLAITDDFALAVLQEKSDRDVIGPKLRGKGTTEYATIADRAETGMRIIEREAVPLVPPDEGALARTYARLKEIHAKAYEWKPPELEQVQRSLQRPMRSYVRRWIAEWDLHRLYPEAGVEIEEKQLETSYDEDRDLEVAPEDDDE